MTDEPASPKRAARAAAPASQSPTPTDPSSPPTPDAPPKSGATAAATTSSPEVAPSSDWETRFKYLLADFENFRRRADRESESVRLRSEADLLKALLPIHEAFERALESSGRAPATDPLRRGMELLAGEWNRFLKRTGVKPVAAPGELFDADLHEAVSEAPARAEKPAGTIVEVVQQGYRFRGGLLRPAKVVVARARLPEAEALERAGDVTGSGSEP